MLGKKLITFLGMGWVLKTERMRVGKGNYVAGYLVMYSLGRFFLEFLRLDVLMVRVGQVGVTLMQGVSLGVMGVSLLWLSGVRLGSDG